MPADLTPILTVAHEALALSGKASPGPWRFWDLQINPRIITDSSGEYAKIAGDYEESGIVNVADVEFIINARTSVPLLAQAVIDLSTALERYRWRPIAELHEDYGDCVLINIKDPGYVKTGSNLDIGFDESKWTHFSQITPLGAEEYERLKSDLIATSRNSQRRKALDELVEAEVEQGLYDKVPPLNED